MKSVEENKGTVVITVKGGVEVSVEGLPKGYNFEIKFEEEEHIPLAYLEEGIIVAGDKKGHIYRSVDLMEPEGWNDLGQISKNRIVTITPLGKGIARATDEAGDIYISVDYGMRWSRRKKGIGVETKR